MRIGISPFSADPGHVLNRWRYDVLIRGLPAAGHHAEYISESGKYDAIIAYISPENEKLFARAAEAGTPVIGEAVDDVLSFPYSNYILPGRIYYALRRVLARDAQVRLAGMMRQCRVLVTGSSALSERFSAYARRTTVVTDAITGDILSRKASHSAAGTTRLVWFGNVSSLQGFRAMGRALDDLADAGGFELVLVTSDYVQGRYLGRWPKTAADFARAQRIPCRIVPWSYSALIEETERCDIGILPVEPDNPYIAAKPAGRALLMMGMGLPVIAGPIRSHCEVISENQTGFIARAPSDWTKAALSLRSFPALRKEIGANASSLVREHYSEKAYTEKYLKILESL